MIYKIILTVWAFCCLLFLALALISVITEFEIPALIIDITFAISVSVPVMGVIWQIVELWRQ